MRRFLLLPAFLFVVGAATAGQADPFAGQSDQRTWDLVQTGESGKFDEKTLTLTLHDATPPTAIAGSTAGLQTRGADTVGDGWRDAVLTFDFNGKTLEATIKIGAATYEGATVSYDVRLISGELAECFDNPRMVSEAMEVAGTSGVEILR